MVGEGRGGGVDGVDCMLPVRQVLRNPLRIFRLDFRHNDDFILDFPRNGRWVIEIAAAECILQRSPSVGGGVVLVPYFGGFDVQDCAEYKDKEGSGKGKAESPSHVQELVKYIHEDLYKGFN